MLVFTITCGLYAPNKGKSKLQYIVGDRKVFEIKLGRKTRRRKRKTFRAEPFGVHNERRGWGGGTSRNTYMRSRKCQCA